jgi:GR25 family glycosyltransferase involved in LPS biosynthesis
MKALVINLDSRPDRLKLAAEQMRLHGIEWQRVPGRLAKRPHEVPATVVSVHRDCWLIAADRDEPTLIFEDDVVLCSDWPQRSAAVIEALPAGWQLVNFHNTKVRKEPVNDMVARSTSEGWGAHAYAVTPSGAGLLAGCTTNLPIDYFLMMECHGKAGVIPYVTMKNMAWQRGDASDNPHGDQSKFWAKQFADQYF